MQNDLLCKRKIIYYSYDSLSLGTLCNCNKRLFNCFLILLAIYLKLTIIMYEKLPKKCIYTIKSSLNKRLI